MDGAGAVFAVGQGHEVIELRLGSQEDGALLGEVLLGQCPRLAAATGQLGLDLFLYCQVAAIGVAQEHQAHDGQAVFVAGVVGIGAQIIGGAPEAFFDGFNVLELRHGLLSWFSSMPDHSFCISVARLLTPARIGPAVDSGIPAWATSAAVSAIASSITVASSEKILSISCSRRPVFWPVW